MAHSSHHPRKAPNKAGGGRITSSRGRSMSDDNIETDIGRMIQPQPGGCWLWTGGASNGYGQTDRTGKVHRFVYETLVGEIPDGHVLHHECRVRNCVNPAHLTPMTPGDHSSMHARERSRVA